MQKIWKYIILLVLTPFITVVLYELYQFIFYALHLYAIPLINQIRLPDKTSASIANSLAVLLYASYDLFGHQDKK